MSGRVRAYVALGANLGERRATLASACDALRALATPADSFAASPVYETLPMGPQDQPDYLNAVVRFDTASTPETLLDALQDIEAAHGRRRIGARRWGERTLDLDLLLYGRSVIATSRLRVPHPGLASRGFVLAPLADLEPGLVLPDGSSVAQHLMRVGRTGLRRLAVRVAKPPR